MTSVDIERLIRPHLANVETYEPVDPPELLAERAGIPTDKIVKLNGSRLIQGYIEDTSIDFKLLAYTMGTDPSYFAIPHDITPATTASWTTVDVSSYVDVNANGVILFIESVTSSPVAYGVREVGSSFATTSLELEEFGNSMYLVGIDSSDQFEAYIESGDIRLYLVAETQGSVVYYTDDTAVAGLDYVADSDTLIFGPTISERKVAIAISDDAIYEANETFFFELSSPSDATIDRDHELSPVDHDALGGDGR